MLLNSVVAVSPSRSLWLIGHETSVIFQFWMEWKPTSKSLFYPIVSGWINVYNVELVHTGMLMSVVVAGGRCSTYRHCDLPYATRRQVSVVGRAASPAPLITPSICSNGDRFTG